MTDPFDRPADAPDPNDSRPTQFMTAHSDWGALLLSVFLATLIAGAGWPWGLFAIIPAMSAVYGARGLYRRWCRENPQPSDPGSVVKE
jgi:hypothetical protein